ncbi:MAG: hypothetical protein M3N57_09985 [Actinomycetota bacterium]|nr:hypothetical protein [Actinomycetota bacterium]
MITCDVCGEPLADDLDAAGLRIDGEHVPFRRGSDWVACSMCGALGNVRDLRVAAGADADAPADPPGGDLRAAAAQALADLHEAVGRRGGSDQLDADALLSALSDVARGEDDASS